jgi:polysaccharide pyruvyl transferase WcaK-like protein
LTARGSVGQGGPSASAPRVGLLGGLGSGNLGNDASMESILGYMKAEHPDAVLDALCTGPEQLRDKYGIEAIPLLWYQKHEQRTSGLTATALKAVSRGIDPFRTASWVRRHDVVIVPGMGVLEASLPMRPWQLPYTMFVLCLSGRIFGTKVALVSVGARVINQRLTRWLLRWAAGLAFYRSYRDTASRDAMYRPGRDALPDPVYPDLVFGMPPSAHGPGDAKTVGVGVMAYRGTNDDDRRQAEQIHRSYRAKIEYFVGWLVDNGYKVRMLIGDANGSDDSVVQEILAGLRVRRPDLDPAQVIAEPVSSYADLTRAMAPVSMVVATRYHNIVCALQLGKPTISIGYAEKNAELMAGMGLAEYCQLINSLDVSRLIEQFIRLQGDSAELRQKVLARNAVNEQLAKDQFDKLSAVLFLAPESPRTSVRRMPAREGNS